MVNKSYKTGKLIKFYSEFYFLEFCQFFIKLLPLKAAYKFMAFWGILAYYLDKHHRMRTIQHMMHAGIAKDLKSAKKLAMKNFIFISKICVEIIVFDKYLTPENIGDHMEWDITPEIKEVMHDPKGMILASAHYGNWEIAGLASSVLVRPIVSVMRPLDNPFVGKRLKEKRMMFNQELCDKKNALKALLKALRKGKAVGILSDQHAGGQEGVDTIFFGHPAKTHVTPAFLHFKTGAPLILGVAQRVGDLKYRFVARGPFTVEKTGNEMQDLQKLTQMFTTELEKIISENPEQWVWAHRRWLDINR